MHVSLCQLDHTGCVAAHRAVKHKALLLLQLQDALFDAVGDDEAGGFDWSMLADAMCPVDGLELSSGVPPRIHDEGVVGDGEIECHSASLEADEEDLAVRVVVESFESHIALLECHVSAQLNTLNTAYCADTVL